MATKKILQCLLAVLLTTAVLLPVAVLADRPPGSRYPVHRLATMIAAQAETLLYVPLAMRDFAPDSTPSATPTATATTAPSPTWRILYDAKVGDMRNIFAVDPDGSNATNLTPDSLNIYRAPAWSPDGTTIAFASTRNSGSGFIRNLFVMNADGSGITQVTTDEMDNDSPSWSPDGDWLAFRAVRSGTDSGIYITDGVTETLVATLGGSADNPSWSPDGTLIAFDDSDDIWVAHPDGSGLTRLTDGPLSNTYPAWSPDGTRIAYSCARSEPQYGVSICIMNSDGSGTAFVTSDSLDERNYHPSWSPDGTQIVFASNPTGAVMDIYVIGADGSGRALVVAGGSNNNPSWGPR